MTCRGTCAGHVGIGTRTVCLFIRRHACACASTPECARACYCATVGIDSIDGITSMDLVPRKAIRGVSPTTATYPTASRVSLYKYATGLMPGVFLQGVHDLPSTTSQVTNCHPCASSRRCDNSADCGYARRQRRRTSPGRSWTRMPQSHWPAQQQRGKDVSCPHQYANSAIPWHVHGAPLRIHVDAHIR